MAQIGAVITADSIRINDSLGNELITWDAQEWREDPDLVLVIANAIDIGHREGPDGIRVRLISQM